MPLLSPGPVFSQAKMFFQLGKHVFLNGGWTWHPLSASAGRPERMHGACVGLFFQGHASTGTGARGPGTRNYPVIWHAINGPSSLWSWKLARSRVLKKLASTLKQQRRKKIVLVLCR